MDVARFRITGNGSLLMNNPSSMRGHTGAIERGGKKIPLPYDEAKSKLYALPNGELFVKSDWFREAGLIAASEVKDPSRKGRATMTRRFAASVFLATETCVLYRASNPKKKITSADEDWEIDTRRVTIQRQGILRSRPKISDWGCVLEFEYDEDLISPEFIASVLEHSGKSPGVGDYRVGKKGPFGRFTVELMNGVKS